VTAAAVAWAASAIVFLAAYAVAGGDDLMRISQSFAARDRDCRGLPRRRARPKAGPPVRTPVTVGIVLEEGADPGLCRAMDQLPKASVAWLCDHRVRRDDPWYSLFAGRHRAASTTSSRTTRWTQS
jgi:hypothetical protein